ncbi:MAG: hypothetical protein ABEJ02_02080, partial [Candidatus Paceibacteria bacterium]
IEKSEQYTSWSDLSQEAKQNNQSNSQVSSNKFQLSEDMVVARGDGTYTLNEGDAVVADNQVGIKLEEITRLSRQQKNKFGQDKYWLKFNFYADGKKITLKPIRFSGVFRANNSNKLYSLDVGYRASRTDIEEGNKQVTVTIDSLDSRKINNCRDLVDLCKQKNRDGEFCERKYCPTEATQGEQVFKEGIYTAVVPDKLEDIGGNILDQMQVCHSSVKDKLQTKSSLDRVVVRFIYGDGSAKTTDIGIVWPVKKDEIQEEIDKWKSKGDSSCSSNLLAHELVHHFARGISMDDIFHEGVANLTAQKVTPDPSSNISCGQKGWSGNSPQSHASQSQIKCYQHCLPACYSSAKQVTIKQGDSYSIDGKKIVIDKLIPKKYWPDTNKTGSYHGEIKYTIKQNGEKLDSQTTYIGDLYDKHGVRFLPDGILIEKIIYPDRTEKTKKVRMRVYSEKRSETPDYCSSSCKPLCQKRIGENTIEYSNLDNYLKLPWKPTFKMFYNTSQCLLSKSEDDYPEMTKHIVQTGKQAQRSAQRYCIGTEIKSKVSQSTFNNLEDIFDIGNECSWQIQRIANIDCWNKSCKPGRTIR